MNTKEPLITDVKSKLDDILIEISWREIAHTYFGKSSSWLYQKLNGIKSDGSKGGGFTSSENQQLKEALFDLSNRINAAAQTL